MTDRKASAERSLGRSRPSTTLADLERLHDHFEDQSTSSTCHTATPVRRKPSSRTRASPNESPHPTSPLWVEADRAEARKAKGGRNTPRKLSRGNSPRTSTTPRPSSTELDSAEKDILGGLPGYNRVFEGRDKSLRQRRDSGTSSTDENDRRRRRPTEYASLTRRPVRQRHGSLQRRAESFCNLPNSSVLSVISGLTNQTTTSSGSNSTITQKSYDKAHHVMKPRPPKGRKKLQAKRAAKGKAGDHPQQNSDVFQYMNKGAAPEPYNARPSSSGATSSSSNVTDIDEGRSSNAGEPEVESPMTSPTSVRHPNHGDDLSLRDRFGRNSGISITESVSDSSSQTSGHYLHHVDEEDEEQDEDEDEDGEEEGQQQEVHEAEEDEESEDEDEEEADNEDARHVHEHRSDGRRQHHPYTLQKTSPPRIPSVPSSQRGERRHQRLKDQERDLRDHVLQSPRPHRDFQFLGVPSPSPNPPMPVSDPYSHAEASSAPYYTQPLHAPSWPPPTHTLPAIGYHSPPQIPPALYPDNSHAMTAHNHVAAASAPVQPPSFHQLQAQPPHYQQFPTGPDPTKTVVGYELLAEKLSEPLKEGKSSGEGHVMPMYRKFESLNHRVLLHLQDEISELEEELRYVDESIAQASPGRESGYLQPASRRAESRYGSELHYKRTDILGRIFLKLGQYNTALSSFSTMKQNLDPANAGDIQTYHDWMEKHGAIDETESRFLEHRDDLLTLPQRKGPTETTAPTAETTVVGGAGLAQSAAIGLPLILVLPLATFAVIPGLFGRVFILSLIGAGQVAVVSSTPELMGLMELKEWFFCASIYFGVMAILAGICV